MPADSFTDRGVCLPRDLPAEGSVGRDLSMGKGTRAVGCAYRGACVQRGCQQMDVSAADYACKEDCS